jgi:hypothetical protein
MTDVTTAADTGAPEQPMISVAPAPAEPSIDARTAARSLATWRHKQREQTTEAPAGEERQDPKDRATAATTESTAPATETGESAAETPPAQTEGVDRQVEPAPIEPPRSWTKEDKELFDALPRETQERIAERERARDSDFSRRQQTATEQAKALEAERLRVEQVRQRYEGALPQLLQTLQDQQAGEFADVRTMADVERLAREDWPRFSQWQLRQMQVASVAQQVEQAQQRHGAEQQRRFSEFAKREDDLFKEKVPDMTDADKAVKLQNAALQALSDLGFAEAELAASWQGQKDLSLRDHRVQLLIRDAVLWREAQAKAKAAAVKPVPPVQRPGAARPAGAERAQRLESLSKRLESTGNLRDAAALLRARRAG